MADVLVELAIGIALIVIVLGAPFGAPVLYYGLVAQDTC